MCAHEEALVDGDLALERDDLLHDCDVLSGDGLHRLDPVDEIVDARRAEQHCERRLIVA